MSNLVELKPCPFCGGEANFSLGFAGMSPVVSCVECNISITCHPIFNKYNGDYMKDKTFEKIKALWNRRSSEK
jgi:hypothetical protein